MSLYFYVYLISVCKRLFVAIDKNCRLETIFVWLVQKMLSEVDEKYILCRGEQTSSKMTPDTSITEKTTVGAGLVPARTSLTADR